MSNTKEFLDRIEYLAKKLALAEQAGRDWSNRVLQLEVARDSLKTQHKEVTAERDKLAAENETLRQEVEAVKNNMSQMERDIEYWRGSQRKAIEAGDSMNAEIETLRKEVASSDKALQCMKADRDHWRESRQQAIEAGELMQAEIETLRGELAAAKRDASEEFVERQVLQHEASDDYVELERLLAFVAAVRESRKKWSHFGGIYYAMRFTVDCDLALAKLDATNPAPASEPTGGAE